MKKTIDEKTICFLYNPSKRDLRKRIRRKDTTYIDDNLVESCPDNKTVVHLSLITWRYRHKTTGEFLRKAKDIQYHEKFYQMRIRCERTTVRMIRCQNNLPWVVDK